MAQVSVGNNRVTFDRVYQINPGVKDEQVRGIARDNGADDVGFTCGDTRYVASGRVSDEQIDKREGTTVIYRDQLCSLNFVDAEKNTREAMPLAHPYDQEIMPCFGAIAGVSVGIFAGVNGTALAPKVDAALNRLVPVAQRAVSAIGRVLTRPAAIQAVAKQSQWTFRTMESGAAAAAAPVAEAAARSFVRPAVVGWTAGLLAAGAIGYGTYRWVTARKPVGSVDVDMMRVVGTKVPD